MDESKPTKPKNQPKNNLKTNNNYDDLFDLEEENNKYKLPTIGVRDKTNNTLNKNKSREDISL